MCAGQRRRRSGTPCFTREHRSCPGVADYLGFSNRSGPSTGRPWPVRLDTGQRIRPVAQQRLTEFRGWSLEGGVWKQTGERGNAVLPRLDALGPGSRKYGRKCGADS